MANSYTIAPDGVVAQPVTMAGGGNNYNVAHFTNTPTITAGAYSAGQLIGGLQTFSGVSSNSGGGGILHKILLSDKAKQSAAIDVVVFSTTPTGTFTDAATFNPGAADLLLISGVISILGSNYSAFSANSVATVNAIGMPYVLAATSLYAVLVSRGTPTYASTSDLTLRLAVLQSG